MRGLQKSQPIEWNVQEAKRMSFSGTKEILVIAQDSTSYGWDLRPRSSLDKLLQSLNDVEDIDWIRLHYAHPAHLKQKIINCFISNIYLTPIDELAFAWGSKSISKTFFSKAASAEDKLTEVVVFPTPPF